MYIKLYIIKYIKILDFRDETNPKFNVFQIRRIILCTYENIDVVVGSNTNLKKDSFRYALSVHFLLFFSFLRITKVIHSLTVSSNRKDEKIF